MAILFGVTLLLMPTMMYSVGVDRCPDRCVCNEQTRSVMCYNTGYTEVPQLPGYTKQLVFTGNSLGMVSSKTFRKVETLNITSLKLDSCNIIGMSPDAFAFLRSLDVLDLSRNNFKNKTIVREVFTAIHKTNITRFSLASANLTSIPKVNKMCPNTLKYLNLGNNRIWYLNTTNLKHGCPSVENLTLSGNFLRKFNFTSIPENVKRLDMHSTKLCQGLPVLCNNNQTILRFLSYLDLSHNAMTTINIFKREGHCLPSLQTLILDSNAYLIRVDTKEFSNLVMLRNLSFRQMNPQTKINGHAFVSKSLESLQLETTLIKDLNRNHQPGQFFQNCSSLTSLSVHNINFKSFNESDLNLLFAPLVNLIQLEIIEGGLTNIGFIGKLPQLRRLNLRRNYISYWDPSVFRNKRNLEYIDFSRNHIAMLKTSDFPDKIWRKTRRIDLHGNPFDCTYDLCGFRHWVSDNHEKLIDYPEKYFCESPDNLKGTQLSKWLPNEEECRKPEKQNNDGVLMEAGIIVGSVVLVACVVGVVIYRKRWNIKHYIYLMRSRKGYESLPDGEAYTYDAFVAYHYTDRPWIVAHLLPYLESQKKLKLCLHERDFLPGNFIADNILNNIESSRKVIVVLSNNFARSEWCQFEATTAYKRVVSDGVSSVVLILLEEISARNVNSVLGNLLTTMTYIDWTDQDAGRALFWSRLDDSLK